MGKSRRSPVPRQKLNRRRASKQTRFESPEFLNIDLDVRSRRSLTPLVAVWPWSYEPLNMRGRPDPHWLILNPRRPAKNSEASAKELLKCIRSLRGAALICWRQAHRRIFDIGVRAGGPGRPFEEVRLTAETLRDIGAVGAQLQVTVYSAEPESPPFVPPRQRQRQSGE